VLASRFAALPEPTQAALLLAAVADSPDLNAAASHGAGPDARALAPAEQLGLVKVDRAGLHFAHPLVRSAIYHSAPFAQRAAAHRELASALRDQPDRRAWHLAAAALHPDEQVAALLEATAAQAQRRGGAAAAALAMERAAELSPDPEDQARRLVAAASAAVPTGQGDWVQDLATRALAVTADPELRLGARHDAAWALAGSGRRTAALPALLSVAEDASRDLPALAWDALGSAATVAYQSGMPASRQAVSRVLDLLERRGSPPSGWPPGIDVDVLRLWIRASADPIGSRNQLLPYLRKVVGSPIEEPSLWRIASAAWLLDESDLAIGLLQDAMQRLRAPGVRGTSGGSLTVLGWAYIDTGRWDEALDVAAEAASLAEANQMELIAASADVITATVLALRADCDAARGHAARALATVDPAECGLVAARARRALGVAALADGSYLQAFTQLRGLFSEDGEPLHNYASYLGVADLAAAAVRADRRMEGSDVIEHALGRLDGTASARLEQLIARARGLLASPDGAEAHFDKALADPAGDQWPFEQAQLRLDYAEWLRRRRRINDAKPVLTQALGTFRRLGARSWAQRAQAELRASGVTVTGAAGEPDALGELTPQQRQIVRLASDGLTDREIGDRLFLSPRTVSSHLYRSYPKLGVASRHQLRDVIARASTPTTAHEST
jgi:DNA-binding CsgD family transcriptional regulator